MDKMDTMPFSWRHPVFQIQYVASIPNPDWYEGLPDDIAWTVGHFTVMISLN